jgi:hypothetical protein
LRLNHAINKGDAITVFTDQVSEEEEDVPQCDPTKVNNEQVNIESLRAELLELRNENISLKAEIQVMAALHERTEKLNENKITILMEMKSALETQVKLLEAK